MGREDFEFTTPRLQLNQDSLSDELLLSRCFHLISSPARCAEQVQGILKRRETVTKDKPIFVWEPRPDTCRPEELENCLQTLKTVDVISPNHNEICGYFGRTGNLSNGELDRSAIEECSKGFLQSGVGSDSQGVVVVRAGAGGCYVVTRETSFWLPAYHTDPAKVVDPTGGGNAFCGGFSVYVARSGYSGNVTVLKEAAAWGSVAASFAIEQVGLPHLSCADAKETWNDVGVLDRLEEYKRRCRS